MTEPASAPAQHLLLQKIYLKDASLEIPHAPQVFTRQWQPQVDVQMSTSMLGLGPEQHQVVLSMTVTAKLEQDVAFLAEVQQAGIFLLPGVTDDAEKKRMLGADCPNMLYPFAREAIAELIVRGGFPQLLLQPVDFSGLYREHLRSEAARH